LPFSFPSQARIEVCRVGSAPCFNALLACTTCRIEIEIDSPMAESECTLLVVVVIAVVGAFIVLCPAHFEFVEGKTAACVSEMIMQ